MKTADLIRGPLDFWVAKAQGDKVTFVSGPVPHLAVQRGAQLVEFSPSTDWAVGGPIIERERITICGPGFMLSGEWEAFIEPILDFPTQDLVGKFSGAGPTPLIAAMRAYVTSKFGEQVANR